MLEICRDEVTGSLQLSIGNENGGYRIAGPKFTGKSKNLVMHIVTKRDADELRSYLDSAFGVPKCTDCGSPKRIAEPSNAQAEAREPDRDSGNKTGVKGSK